MGKKEFEQMQTKFSEQMQTYTQPFLPQEFITPEALYALASIGGNTHTIPFVPFPEDFDAQRGLERLKPAYIQDEILTELAREVIVAIEWMQKSQYVAIINEISFFYEKEGLPVTIIVSNDTYTGLRLAYRYKTAELLGVIGACTWMNKPLNKEQRLIQQSVQVKDVIERFEGRENLSISLYENGNVVYNSIFFEYDSGVVKYDATRDVIEEQAGRFWLKEIIEKLHVNKEFRFDKEDNRKEF